MLDLLIDPKTKDLIVDGGLKLTTEDDLYLQTVLLGLQLNLGEFFTHTNHGLPWVKDPNLTLGENVRYFLGTSFPNPEIFLFKELNNYLNKLPFVVKVESNYRFDKNNRAFEYDALIRTKTGSTIEVPKYITTI